MSETAEAAIMSKKRKLTQSQRGGLNKSKQRPTIVPAPWDLGAKGPANQAGLIVEDATEETPQGRAANPNGVKRARRVYWPKQYADQGKLENRHLMAALELLRASAGSGSGDPLAALGMRVDDFRGKAEPEAAKYDARKRYRLMMDQIPRSSRFVVEWVVIENKSIAGMPGAKSGQSVERRMKRLRDGLEEICY